MVKSFMMPERATDDKGCRRPPHDKFLSYTARAWQGDAMTEHSLTPCISATKEPKYGLRGKPMADLYFLHFTVCSPLHEVAPA